MDLGVRPGPRPEAQFQIGTEVGMESGTKVLPLGKLVGWGVALNDEGKMQKVALIKVPTMMKGSFAPFVKSGSFMPFEVETDILPINPTLLKSV